MTITSMEEQCVGRIDVASVLMSGNAGNDIERALPAELQRVLLLPRDLRQCFVLRLLMGLPRERCAQLLGVDIAQVKHMTAMAAIELAEIAAREQ